MQKLPADYSHLIRTNKMKQHTTITFVNDLIEVLLQNLIYYIPSELIIGEVLDQIEDDIPDSFFDELSLFDLEKGVFLIHNEDTFSDQ